MMFIIADEDMGKVNKVVNGVMQGLASGVAQRIDATVSVGEDIPVLDVVGYWVRNIIRIDIKRKK